MCLFWSPEFVGGTNRSCLAGEEIKEEINIFFKIG